MNKACLLTIDDDELVLTSYKMLFEDDSIEVQTCASGPMGIEVFRHNPKKFAVVLLDYNLTNKSDGSGITGDIVASQLKEIDPHVHIIMVSGNNNSEVIEACHAAGADNFITKSTAVEKLRNSVLAILSSLDTVIEQSRNEQERSQKIHKVLKMVGKSRELERVAELVEIFCNYDEPVLILGESGVGKEGIAKSVHNNSRRQKNNFVAVNCTAIGKELLESELFGHERGSFTGAINKKVGLFEQADGGTIFLDEIGDMPLELQAKLLRTLQEKTIHPVGGKSKSVDFRVVCATHQNLEQAVANGTFRQDLYYRIKYMTIDVPALRERPEDIEPLVFHFIKSMSLRTGQEKNISQGALRTIKSHKWPGNVRDLEGVVKKAFAISQHTILPEHLRDEIASNGLNQIDAIKKAEELMNYEEFEQHVLEAEKHLLNRVLKATGYVKKAAAGILGISANTLQYRILKLGIEKD